MIEVGRNSIIIRNVDFESSEYNKFYRAFSLFDMVTHKYTFTTFTIVGDDIHMPASTGYQTIQKYFPGKKILFNYQTTTKAKPAVFNMLHTPRDEIQKESFKFLKDIKTDNDCRERFLSLATGSGKTFVTISLISYLKMKSFIIVDTVDLASQWKGEFLKHTDIKEDEIAILSGRESIEAYSKDSSQIKVFIAIHKTLGMLLEEDDNSINKLMDDLGIGVRVFDEAHVNFKNVCSISELSNVEYTLYLTATPSRSNFRDDTLYGKIFRKIPYYDGKNIGISNYHTVLLGHFNSNPDIVTKAKIKTKHGFNIPKWSQHISEDGFDNYMESLTLLIEKLSLLKRNKKVAIMLPTIELIEKTKEKLKETYPEMDIGTFIGSIKPADRKAELDKMFILTNDKIFGKAIDVPDLEILITYVPLSSAVKIEQIMGRLRYHEGQSQILIDMTDYGFHECINQQKARKRFYKKKAKNINEIL